METRVIDPKEMNFHDGIEPLSEEQMEGVYLPKWPAFVVVGEPVTKDQAQQIIIRTMSLPFCTNDKEFSRQLYEVIGVDCKEHEYYPDTEKAREELGMLSYTDAYGYESPLEYCGNYRVVSSYIGGPHGWIDWNGNIGCSSYNIGKHPSVRTVYREWQVIAEAFPFLDLQCQLFDGESCEDGIKPVVQYNVCDGNVVCFIPMKRISCPFNDVYIGVSRLMMGNNAERGCTIGEFKQAVKQVRRVIANDGQHKLQE